MDTIVVDRVKHNKWLNKKKRNVAIYISGVCDLYYLIKKDDDENIIVSLGKMSRCIQLSYSNDNESIELINNGTILLLPKKHKYRFSIRLIAKHIVGAYTTNGKAVNPKQVCDYKYKHYRRK